MGEVGIRIHGRVGIEEPCLYEARRVGCVRVRAIENPRHGIVQHRIRHDIEVARIIHHEYVWVQSVVALIIRAG